MASIPIVGKVFENVDSFLKYLDGVTFNLWRPRFVTLHHTGAPDLKTWEGWQTRAKPVSDEQWLKNLAGYYGGLGWSSGPHFFVTPKHICVLSPPNKRGVHAVSFNATSWGVECVGDFDRERFEGSIKAKLIDALAALHIAAGLQIGGLMFHRDDPKTSKTCPGKNIDKGELIAEVASRIASLTRGDHPEEHIEAPVSRTRRGTVKVPAGDTLNVRSAASGKAPVLTILGPGQAVEITGQSMNGETQWLRIDLPGDADGWVAARFVDEKRA